MNIELKGHIVNLQERLKVYEASDSEYLKKSMLSLFKKLPLLSAEIEDMVNLLMNLMRCSGAEIEEVRLCRRK